MRRNPLLFLFLIAKKTRPVGPKNSLLVKTHKSRRPFPLVKPAFSRPPQKVHADLNGRGPVREKLRERGSGKAPKGHLLHQGCAQSCCFSDPAGVVCSLDAGY